MVVETIPSGSKATVGIKGIPRYILGAITTKYVSPAQESHKINITLTFKLGEETKEVKTTKKVQKKKIEALINLLKTVKEY